MSFLLYPFGNVESVYFGTDAVRSKFGKIDKNHIFLQKNMLIIDRKHIKNYFFLSINIHFISSIWYN